MGATQRFQSFAGRQRGIAQAAALALLALAAWLVISRGTSPDAMLEAAATRADPTWNVTLKLNQAKIKIGSDDITLSITTARPGYLLVFQAGTDGKTLELIFPNDLTKNGAVVGGEIRLPGEEWQLKSEGPAGEGALLAVLLPDVPVLEAIKAALAGGHLPEFGTSYGAALARYNEAED